MSQEPKVCRIALAQINPIVGGFDYNIDKIVESLDRAREVDADMVVFPELAITGYPPEDLLLREDFLQASVNHMQRIVPYTGGLTVVVGYAEPGVSRAHNSAALICDGQYLGSYRKMVLPNYGVFDEKRYFTEGEQPVRVLHQGVFFGITICEDIWIDDGPGNRLCDEGLVDVVLNLSSSPFHEGKTQTRKDLLKKRARSYKAYIAYTNLVGGQDDLVFDGQSLIVSPSGECIAQGQSFAEDLIVMDVAVPNPKNGPSSPVGIKGITTFSTEKFGEETPVNRTPLPERTLDNKPPIQEIYEALVLGTRDYILKNGFDKVVLGLSGGIDSALTTVIAAVALGSDKVVGVLMPSPYSSRGSVHDSKTLARNLEIEILSIPIQGLMKAYHKALAPHFGDTLPGIAEENLQARIRGNLLMALSNKFGWLVLTTGNKSELSVGYCTLYGDMAGGFGILKDVSKTRVYELALFINKQKGREWIPKSIIKKPPSAELKPDQMDTDSLPPYEELDPILKQYVEENGTPDKLKHLGDSQEVIEQIIRWVDASEYKRRQAPPGIKISKRAFGKDRRLPITNNYNKLC